MKNLVDMVNKVQLQVEVDVDQQDLEIEMKVEVDMMNMEMDRNMEGIHMGLDIHMDVEDHDYP